MLKIYKIVELDCKFTDRIPQSYQDDPAISAALAAVSYRPLLRNWTLRPDDRLFVLDDPYNQQLRSGYEDMAAQAHAIAPCGELLFERIWCLGRDGLRVDCDNGVVFIGHSVNWSREYFNWWIEASDVGFIQWLNDDTFLADFGESERRDDDIVMMKAPGYGIFGHWLLDLVPQLVLTRFMAASDDVRFVFDHLTDWMKTLLVAVGITHVDSYQHLLTEHHHMRMPTGLKCGFALAQPINGLAWSELRARFNHMNCSAAPAPATRLFISRKKWAGQRSLADYALLEDMMASLGFTIFYPEEHDLTAQAHAFSAARLIVGEDGSALHSVLFTQPGAVLGILMQPDRMNLWHAGICDTMGHRLAYHQLPAADPSGDAPLDLDAIATFVQRLEAAG
ncbi:glycosyltransferase family 61 protein [Novosphingobium sp. SL115]|uniref:glycosyltransferase family 61 protein n=1 Tax=Novosphingobium sp. SL115 TaxID=2995150 RepID=UPI0022727277|nr:glycosyltransferase family 61 protein [Novosphingobium sp. SL115]MCY1670973.1 glycosyltransferase family 61 protein [Novosphingobium sp. SL115]